ncbi:MAG: PepSY domain-containing protein [Pyrinomonadaceae bacterium]
MNRITIQVSKELRAVPGVRNFGSHIGRAEVADEVVGPNFAELWISIDPEADYEPTVAKIQSVVDGYPGLYRDVLTYLKERIKEVLTGGSASMVVRAASLNYPRFRCTSKASELELTTTLAPMVADVHPVGQSARASKKGRLMKSQTSIMILLLAALVVSVPLTASAQNRQSQEGKTPQSKQQKERDDRDDAAEEAEDAEEDQATLKKEAKITLEQARETALNRAPGKIEEEELEREDGNLVYSFDIRNAGGTITEVHVSAIDNTVVAVEKETAEQEAAEKKKEEQERQQQQRRRRSNQRKP